MCSRWGNSLLSKFLIINYSYFASLKTITISCNIYIIAYDIHTSKWGKLARKEA